MYQAGIWTFYTCQLDRSLRRGEEHEFEVVWTPLDNWRNSSPFVSTSTEEPCRELEFVVRIPENALFNKDVYVEEMRGIEAAHAFKTSLESFNHGEFKWPMKPKLYRHYRVRWSWAGDGEVPAMLLTDSGEQEG